MADLIDNSGGKDMQPAPRAESLKTDVATWLLPSLVLCGLGGWAGSYGDVGIGTAVLLECSWTAAFIALGLRIIHQQYFLVIERLGRFNSVKYSWDAISLFFLKDTGLVWINPFFDKIKLRECFSARAFPLYKNDKQAEIDFTDASAPITAKAWYSIANPVDVANEDSDEVTRQVALWSYRYDDPRERAGAIFDGALRPLLQAMSIDDVQTKGDEVCEQAVQAARPILAGLGAYPVSSKALIIDDVALPATVIAIREKKLEGEKLAAQAEEQFQGPARAINGIIKAAEALGHTIDFETARGIMQQTQILEAIGNSKANISFVAPDMPGVLKTIAVGKKD